MFTPGPAWRWSTWQTCCSVVPRQAKEPPQATGCSKRLAPACGDLRVTPQNPKASVFPSVQWCCAIQWDDQISHF